MFMRQLTATGKAKTAGHTTARSGFEIRDKRGFISTLGDMPGPPQNDAGHSDNQVRYEGYDVRTRVWSQAPWAMVRRMAKLTPEKRALFLRTFSGLIRALPQDARGLDKGTQEVWDCPRDYDLSLDRTRALQKALKCGLLTLGQRTYRLKQLRPDTYQVTGARGATNYSKDALLDVLANGHF